MIESVKQYLVLKPFVLKGESNFSSGILVNKNYIVSISIRFKLFINSEYVNTYKEEFVEALINEGYIKDN